MSLRFSRRPLAALVAISAIAASAAAPAARADTAFTDALRPVQSRELANGMTVIVQEDHRLPMVSLALRYAAGERAAPDDRPGVATLTSYLMGRASKHVGPGEGVRLLGRAGLFTMSGDTTRDAMTFQVTLPAHQYALPLWLWSDAMGFFEAGVDDMQLALRRTTLRDQRRAGLEGDPLGRLDAIIDPEVFPDGHPYHRTMLGTPEAIERIDRDAILAFHDRWVTPDHAVLAIVGDVSAPDVFRDAEKYFGPVPPSVKREHTTASTPTLAGETQIDIAARVTTPRVIVRWPTPRLLTTEDARLDVVAQLLDGQHTAILYWTLVDERKVARRVTARQYSRELASYFEIMVEGEPGRSPDELLKALDDAMVGARSRQITANAIRTATYEQLIGRAFSPESAWSRASDFAKYFSLVGVPEFIGHDFDRYEHITPDVLRQTIERWLPADRRVVALVTPTPSAAPGGEARARRFVPARTR